MNKHDVGGVIKNEVKLNHTIKTSTPVVNLLISTTEKIRTKTGEQKTIKNIHNVTCWGKTAHIVSQNYKKGDYIVVSGRSETVPKDNGFSTELIVNTVENIHRGNK